MAKQPRPRGPRLAILTNGGGPGVMAADTLARYGQSPAVLDHQMLNAFDAFLPPFWSRANPIDILGDASAERSERPGGLFSLKKSGRGAGHPCAQALPTLFPSPKPDRCDEGPRVSGICLLDGRQTHVQGC